MGVSKSMKGQMGQALGPDELRKFFAHTVRVNRGPVQLGKHRNAQYASMIIKTSARVCSE